MLEIQYSYSGAVKVVLLAEADVINYFYIKTVCKRLGVEVLVARNPNEAINLIQQFPEINLMFFDLTRMIINHIACIKIIKSIRKDLHIVATNAYPLSIDIEKSKKEGFDEILSQPVKMETLISTINKYLNMASEERRS
jgi:CheY-like chemotaxis protein